MDTVIVIILSCLSLLLIWQFVGYPLTMAFIAILSKPKIKNYEYTPFVSIIVPAYNEANVIRNRIDNLLALDYPVDNYEIIIVESGSTDDTYQITKNIIEDKGAHGPDIILIQEEVRRGKASAINLGREKAKGELILVTDANTVFSENVLMEMAPYFENPDIGAVGGRTGITSQKEHLAVSESFYWVLEYIVRVGESSLSSACLFHGEINMWRKNIVDADCNSLSEDLDMAIRINRAGYKIEYEPEAMAYEPLATTVGDQIKQRKRTTIGTIQCLFKHSSYFIPPRDLYSFFIFPSHKIITILSPFFILGILLLYILSWDKMIVLTHFASTLLIFALLLIALLLVKIRLPDNGKKSSPLTVSSIPIITFYVLLNEYLILIAWKDFLFGKYSPLWAKAESTRKI